MVNVYGFADEISSSIDRQIEGLLINRLNGLEIRNIDGENVSDITFDKAEEVRRKLDANGLVTWSVASPIGKIEIIDKNVDSHFEKLKRTLEIASVLKSDNIRIFSYYIPVNKHPENYRETVFEKLFKMSELAKPYGVNLCIENEKGVYGDTADRLFDILSSVRGLKCVFDPANFVQCGVDVKYAWKLLHDKVHYLHIKDCDQSGKILPAGEGEAQIEYITNQFIGNGGSNITLEPHLVEFEGLNTLERSGDKSVISVGRFSNSEDAFDYACLSFRQIITKITEVSKK